MKTSAKYASHVLVALAGTLLVTLDAEAYAGPGGVVTGAGAVLALIAVVFAAFFGFLWYPIKRAAKWLHRVRGGRTSADSPIVGEAANP